MMAAAAGESVDTLPEGFDDWPAGARRAYLEATLDRRELLDLVADRAGLAGGNGDLTKYHLATIAVELGGGARE